MDKDLTTHFNELSVISDSVCHSSAHRKEMEADVEEEEVWGSLIQHLFNMVFTLCI